MFSLAKISAFVRRNQFLVILLFLTFFVRLPSLFEPFWYGDEAIYGVIGQKILRGGLLYVDIFDHKTPGIYYLTAAALKIFGQTIWSLHFLLMIWVLVTLVFFFILGKKLFDERVAKIATTILAALTAITFFEGNIFNSEILMILPISIGLLFGFKKKYFWSGFFFSLALLLKFPALFDFGAFFVFVCLQTVRKNLKENLLNLFFLTLGYLTPLTLSVLYFFAKGAFSAYLYSALLYNFSYTNYGNKLVFGTVTINNGLILLKGLPLIALVLYFFWKLYLHLIKEENKATSNFEFVVLWLAFAFYGAVFGGRPYPHYLIQPLPALSLLLALAVFPNYRKVSAGIAAFLVILVFLLGFKPYFRPSYYTNFFRLLGGQIKQEEYLNSFDPNTSRNYALASFIDGCESYNKPGSCTQTRTSQNDNIYIWGDSPVIYFLTQRDPTSKYITAFHVEGNNQFKNEVIASVDSRQPKYILVEKATADFPELDKILQRQYNLFAQTDDVKIYQHSGSHQAD